MHILKTVQNGKNWCTRPLKMYTVMVRPLLEYAAPVWDPCQQNLIAALERVQKMALRMCAKNWSANYEDLLLQFNLPSLRLRRKLLKLSFFQTHNGNFHSLGSPVHPYPMDPRLRGYDPARIASLMPRSTAYKSSFFLMLLHYGMTFLLNSVLCNHYLSSRMRS